MKAQVHGLDGKPITIEEFKELIKILMDIKPRREKNNGTQRAEAEQEQSEKNQG